MALGKFWFIDPKGQQREGEGMDAVMAAVARGDLLPHSNFYDPALNAWKPASEVPALAGTLGGHLNPPPPPPPPAPVMPPPPNLFVQGGGFPPPVPVATTPGMHKPLTFVFILGATVLSTMANRKEGVSTAVTAGSSLFGVVVVTAIIVGIIFGIAMLVGSKPRRPWLLWMSVSLFMLLSTGYQLATGTGVNSDSPAPAIQNPGQNNPGGQGGNTQQPTNGGGFRPNS